MADIDLETSRNEATEKYHTLIENLFEANGEGTFNMSPEDFVQAVNDSGLNEVFGPDQADNVSIYIDEVYEPETDDMSEQYYHPIVIEIGIVPSEFENNNEDFADDDGSARITIWDDDLSELQLGVNVVAWNDAMDTGENLSNEKVESITEYNIHSDSVERQVDAVRTEGSDTIFIIDPNHDRMKEQHTEVTDDFSLYTREDSLSAADIDIDEFKAENPDSVTTHDIEYTFDENLDTTVSIDGQEMFTEHGGVDSDELISFCVENSDAIDVVVERGQPFENLSDFQNCVSNESAWLEELPDFIDEHEDAIAYIDEHIDEYGGYEAVGKDPLGLIDEVEKSGVLDNIDSDEEPDTSVDEKLDFISSIDFNDIINESIMDYKELAGEDSDNTDNDSQNQDTEQNNEASIDNEYGQDDADIGESDDIDDNDSWDSGDSVD